MSWYATAKDIERASAKNTLSALDPHLGTTPARQECLAQCAQAVEVAVALIESGVVGRGLYQVELSGHANPGYEDAPGWANDCVNVRVTRQSH